MSLSYTDIKSIIDEWDPIELLITHAPPDEYDYETKEIFDTIQKNHKISANDLTNNIFRFFTKNFGSDTFTKDAEECQEIAEKILSSVV
ncbi:DUF1871 family protein [Lacrimispora sp.]|jgi:hypothetical protein|uniref:DUF1871 family protein n=1 Tax=Lacrimispora sp. TaxID=2719234 RepID=UPI0028A08A61|nr:DUF1871 family protein [Lacrimispora sp.]